MAFSIDTSAPILSLSQKSAESVENVSAIFGANTVITEDDGSYTIEGLTEKSSTLTIDGEIDGITVMKTEVSVLPKNYQIMKIINRIR